MFLGKVNIIPIKKYMNKYLRKN